jgi:hypothetical protein
MRIIITCLSTFSFLLILTYSGRAQLWEELGQGMLGMSTAHVSNFYSSADKLYVGGTFTRTASDETVSKIMVWDGELLLPLGCGFDWDCIPQSSIPPATSVTSIILYNDTLIAGGGFSFSGDIPINGIGFWNGVEWQSFSDGFYPGVSGLYIHNDTLFVSGGFTEYNGTEMNGLAKWDGSTWQNVHNFPHWSEWKTSPNAVKAMEWYIDELYVGGNWTASDLENMDDLVKWDGTTWTSVGGGLHGGLANVNDMTVFKDKLYVAGWFNQFESPLNPGNFIAAWDGESWDDLQGGTVNPLNPGANGQVNDLFATDDYLYVVGQFHYAGGINTDFIARWDGEEWCGYAATEEGYFLWNPIYAACIFQEELYIGGQFHTVNNVDDMDILLKYIGPDECLLSGTNDLALDLPSVEVFPNPASDKITLQSEHVIMNVGITNAIGQNILNYEIHQNTIQLELDVSILVQGVYFLSVKTQDGILMQSFVKN